MDLTTICPLTIAAALQRSCAVAPDVEAVVASDGRVTFAQLAKQVDGIAEALSASGIKKGDHIGVCAGNSVRWAALLLAIGTVGAVAVPINTRFRQEELRFALTQSQVKLLFTADRILNSDFLSMLLELCPSLNRTLPGEEFPHLREVVVMGDNVPVAGTPWSEYVKRRADVKVADATPDDVLLIQYTSGTTAFPKGVMLTHRNMLANAFFAGERMGLRVGDRYHSARPFFHVAGSTLSVLAALQHATTLVTMDRFDPGEALQLMESERCTHVSGNDTMLLMLLNHPDRSDRKLSLRGGWVAAQPSIVERFINEMGANEAVTTYGLSEASPNVAISCWWEPMDVRMNSRMRPQPGLDVRIRGVDTGQFCPPDTIGEIVVRGWSVMKGYYNQQEETAKAIDKNGWLSTGDLGRMGTDGRLEFIGRLKDIIRVGGENISPLEVEDLFHTHPSIRQAQIVGVPDARLVEVVAAFIILKEGCHLGRDELLAWSKRKMAGYKVPRYLAFVNDFDSIGMTASAKVQKKKLAAHARQLFGLQG